MRAAAYEVNDLNLITIADNGRIPFIAPHYSVVEFNCDSFRSKNEDGNQIGKAQVVVKLSRLIVHTYLHLRG